jgi:hypothetical protein
LWNSYSDTATSTSSFYSGRPWEGLFYKPIDLKMIDKSFLKRLLLGKEIFSSLILKFSKILVKKSGGNNEYRKGFFPLLGSSF